jgi:E3 ubiquitin-protein ligase DOA10
MMVRVSVDIGLDASIFLIGGFLLSAHSIVRHFLSYGEIVFPVLGKYVDYLDQSDFKETYLGFTQSAGRRILQVFDNSTRTSETFLDHPLLSHLKQKTAEYADFTALKGTITEKVIAVIAGYFIFTCLGAIYLRVRKLREPHNQADNTERLIRDILRQAGAVLKVVVIITIELVAFPIFCGTLIDIACLPLFANASLSSRLLFAQNFTFTATFLHWFAGTLYMFHFAMFVSMCRDLVRAGTLYFIRDPNDPQFHPIREILERPTLHQLRKIGVSGIIYAILILLCFGIVVKSVDLCGNVLPLQISTMEPVFEVPVDLLMSHIAIPLTAHFVKPSAVIKTAWRWWFKITARMLRLSSFLFGTRVPDEEGSIPFSEILKFKRRPSIEEVVRDSFHPNGSFLRVPATDTIPLHRRKQMLIPVTEDNRRLDGLEETDELRNDMDFRVVYVPPHFSTRITILFAWMWVYSVILGLSVTLVPCTSPSDIVDDSTSGSTNLPHLFRSRNNDARHLRLRPRLVHIDCHRSIDRIHQ